MYCHGHHGAAPREPPSPGTRPGHAPAGGPGGGPGRGPRAGPGMGRPRGSTTCWAGWGGYWGRAPRRTGDWEAIGEGRGLDRLGARGGEATWGCRAQPGCSFWERFLPGRSLLGRLLSLLCSAARDRPGSPPAYVQPCRTQQAYSWYYCQDPPGHYPYAKSVRRAGRRLLLLRRPRADRSDGAMNYRQCFLVSLMLLVLSGCATLPTGPSVMVLPNPGSPSTCFRPRMPRAGCMRASR